MDGTENIMGEEETKTEEATEQTTEETTEETAEKDEATLTEEALSATEETEEKPEDMVPATVVKKQRERARAAELEAARLKGELEAREKPETTAEEKSPVDKFVEEYGEETPLDGKTYREQKAYEKRQAEKQQQSQQHSTYLEGMKTGAVEMSDAKLGDGLGLNALSKLGGELLTTGDNVDIFQAGKNSGKVAYQRLKNRIIEAGGDAALELQRRIEAHKKTQADPKKSKDSKPDKPEEKKEEKKEAPKQEEILSASDAHVTGMFLD